MTNPRAHDGSAEVRFKALHDACVKAVGQHSFEVFERTLPQAVGFGKRERAVAMIMAHLRAAAIMCVGSEIDAREFDGKLEGLTASLKDSLVQRARARRARQ